MDCVEDDCKKPVSSKDAEELLLLNNELLKIVTSYKDKITEYYKNRSWDKYKKISNEYEHIFYSPNAHGNISLYNPVSRSFFKLWEILYDYEDVLHVKSSPFMKCVFLAEGPGGFFEAFHKRRTSCMPDNKDMYYGITLRSNNNRNVPDWKTQKSLPITISYGKDGTGNLYNIDNITHFAENVVGKNSCDFITADGGFDFSSDFNNQEDQSMRLIASEVLACLLLQKKGGNFLLKLYDCFCESTIIILHILSNNYRSLHFIKPLTSRPANSERYLLCVDFHGSMNDHDVSVLENIIAQKPDIGHAAPDINTLYNIVIYNLYYTIRQVHYIQRTINYINFFKKQSEDTVMNSILEKHINKSRKWCVKYDIPVKDLL